MAGRAASRFVLWFFAAVLAALLAAVPAQAQDQGPYETLSCERRIEFWVTEVGLPPTRASNDVIAAPYLDRECKGGLDSSCPCVRGLARRGKTPEAGEALVRQELEPLCTGGDGWACFRLSRLVGWYTKDENLTRQSLAQMVRGCDIDFAPACVAAGSMQIGLSTSEAEYKTGLGMLERACDIDKLNPLPCALAAMYNSAPQKPFMSPDLSRAVSFLERTCERNEAVGCSGAALAYGNGSGVPMDLSRARALYERGCDLGAVDACTKFSQMLYYADGGPRDFHRAARLATTSCDAGDMEACAGLGGMYYFGHGVNKDRARAFVLALRACDGEDMHGCHNAASALSLGEGVERSLANARFYYEKACLLGFDESCDEITAQEESAAKAHSTVAPVKQDRAAKPALLSKAATRK